MAKPIYRIFLTALIGLLFWNCDQLGIGEGDNATGPKDTVNTNGHSNSGINHAPTIGLGLHDISMLEGESKAITLRGKDEDGDPIHFSIPNLDSLRALFPDGKKAIEVVTGGDSIVIGFYPGSAKGNYRFRIAVMDTSGGVEEQILTITVGKVNRPPSISFASPATGTVFRIKEGKTISLRVIASDPDGDAVTLQALSNTPWSRFGQGSYDTKTGILTFTPSFQCVSSGETTFSDLVFRAKDNGAPSETGQLSARITVQDSNSAPVWKTNAASLQGQEGREMTLDLAPLFQGDNEKDGVEFTATNGTVDKAAMKWSFTPGFRDAGQKECVITASDSHKPPLSSKLTLTLVIADSVRLVDVAILAPVSGLIVRDTVVAVKWTVGDQLQAAENTEILKAEGPNVIRRSWRDSLGNNGTDSVTVFRDTRAPLAPRVSVAALSNTPLPRWTWTSGGEGSGIYRVRLDNPDPAAPMIDVLDSVFTPPRNLPEGTHVLYVQERDEAGNWSAAGSGTVRIDLTPPVVKILSPLTGIYTNAPSIAVKWTLDGQEQALQAVESLPSDGVIQIRREAFDSAGNRGADSVIVIRKSVAGAAPAVSGTAGPTRNPQWTWSRGQGGIATFRIGWQEGSWFDTLTSMAYAGASDLAEGKAVLYVSELDSAGNWSPSGSFQVTVDRTAPVLSITGPDAESAISSVDPAVTGTAAEENGLASVTWSVPGLGGGSAALSGNGWTVATIAFPAGDHVVSLTALDAAGNQSAAATVTVFKRPNTLFVRQGFTGKGTSWKDAFGDLSQALASPVGAKGATVWMADGDYTSASPMTVPARVEIYGGFNPDGSGKSIADRGLADLKTVINASNAANSHAVSMPGLASVLDGLKITSLGGAISSAEGNTVRNCWVLNAGGAAPVLIAGAKGDSFNLTNTRIEGASAADKGALVIEADMKATLTNCSITGNNSLGASSGGGLWIGGSARVNAKGLTLSGNTVPDSVGVKARQGHIEDGARVDIDGTVQGDMAGFEIMPGAKVKLNGVDGP
ncbi:MAG: hypothetical protein JWP91_4539 [Fibrobacteres bacterium]|nr:hypothetical protein [Fibrobacterota bacterium]